MQYMRIEDISIHPDLSTLFEIDKEVLMWISQDMGDNGFDENCPIIIAKGDWTEGEKYVLDGHTRIKAARIHGIEEVPFFWYECETFEQAADYAISLQQNRRNLTQVELLRCIDLFRDRRCKVGRPLKTLSRDRIKSNKEIAESLGVSEAYVTKANLVNDSGEEDIKADMMSGKIGVRTAYEKILNRKKPMSERTEKRLQLVQERGIPELKAGLENGDFTISGAAEIAELPEDAQRVLVTEMSPVKAVQCARTAREQNVNEKVDRDALEAEMVGTRYRLFTETKRTDGLADWEWNPVTGCQEECPYCYARYQAEVHYREAIPDEDMRFKPRLRREMLAAPYNTQPSNIFSSISSNKVITCDMGDLLGDGVPSEWVLDVIKAMRDTAHWTYLVSTVNPWRFLDFDWPKNVWLGATANTEERMERALGAFQEIALNTRYLQIEPMVEEVSIGTEFGCCDWVIIGAQKRTPRVEPKQPEWRWVYRVTQEAEALDIPVYWRSSLHVAPRSYPR